MEHAGPRPTCLEDFQAAGVERATVQLTIRSP
jgi:hypothetical protein